MMWEDEYIRKWTEKVIALDKAMKVEVPIKDAEELMITLLTELLGETSISDEEYENWKNHFRFNGLGESDVADVLKRVAEVN